MANPVYMGLSNGEGIRFKLRSDWAVTTGPVLGSEFVERLKKTGAEIKNYTPLSDGRKMAQVKFIATEQK